MRTIKALLVVLVVATIVRGQSPPESVATSQNQSVASGDSTGPDDAAGGPTTPGRAPISGNPAAVNIVAGTGKLGELLGLEKESGLRLGGLWLGDASGVLVGGARPGQWGLNSLTVLDLNADTEKLGGWRGGLFGIQFLQYTGEPTNALAGTVQGFDSINGPPPFTRQELYQLWFRQELIEDKLTVRIGKTVPTYDFGNVLRPVPTDDPAAVIPAVSGLTFTPIFVNPTILGKIPGYYNSAVGITTTFTPTERIYASFGSYDGNLATGDQTGLMGPQFTGHYFHIGEIGRDWEIGEQNKPGMAAVGMWHQTGPLRAVNGTTVSGANGVYAFGSQRLWFRHPGVDNSGVSGFAQFGANNTNTAFVRQYYGAGLTAFGLTPGRAHDSMGCGMAWSVLNDDPAIALRNDELMFQSYYQMNVMSGVFFQTTLTYIPTPGRSPDLPAAFAISTRLTVLF